MNIFILEHRKPNESLGDWCKRIAHSHCDQHNKLILEAWQQLNTNCNVLGIPTDNPAKAYVNHPCTVWARSSEKNWLFLINYAEQLAGDMAERHNKSQLHKSYERILDNIPFEPLSFYKGKQWLKAKDLTTPAKAMPDSIKKKYPQTMEGTINAYREYYSKHKAYFARKDNKNQGKYIITPAKWKHGNVPTWFEPPTVEEALKAGYITATCWTNPKKTVTLCSMDQISSIKS